MAENKHIGQGRKSNMSGQEPNTDQGQKIYDGAWRTSIWKILGKLKYLNMIIEQYEYNNDIHAKPTRWHRQALKKHPQIYRAELVEILLSIVYIKLSKQ